MVSIQALLGPNNWGHLTGFAKPGFPIWNPVAFKPEDSWTHHIALRIGFIFHSRDVTKCSDLFHPEQRNQSPRSMQCFSHSSMRSGSWDYWEDSARDQVGWTNRSPQLHRHQPEGQPGQCTGLSNGNTRTVLGSHWARIFLETESVSLWGFMESLHFTESTLEGWVSSKWNLCPNTFRCPVIKQKHSSNLKLSVSVKKSGTHASVQTLFACNARRFIGLSN